MAIQSATSAVNQINISNYAPATPRVTVESIAVEMPATAVQAVEKEPTASELKNAVEGINRTLKHVNSNLEFSIDTDTQLVVVKLVDKLQGDVIRQFPSKETIAIARAIDEFQKGLFLNKQA